MKFYEIKVSNIKIIENNQYDASNPRHIIN